MIQPAIAAPEAHPHEHRQNRFAVAPTPEKVGADRVYTGRGVTIAFLDSGFYPHPDLTEPVNRILAHHDLSGADDSFAASAPVKSWQWHGTMVSVVAAGNGRLSDHVYHGIATGAELVLVKVSEQEGVITEESIARGIEWVIENRERYGIRVLNISLGGDRDIPCRESRIDQLAENAVESGIVVIVAAGNSGDAERHHSIPPANSPSVITVGGYDDHNSFASSNFDLYHSNYGPTADGTLKPEIIGPSVWVAAPLLPRTPDYKAAERLSQIISVPDYQLRSILLAHWREAGLPESILYEDIQRIRELIEEHLRDKRIVATHYQHADGTSFAAPIVSSVVAQMLEANPRLTPAAVKHLLISTADRIAGAPAVRQGYGRLNARRAVVEAARERHTFDPAGHGPPHIVGGEVVFLYHDDLARAVALAGDFNNWNPTACPLAREPDGLWRGRLRNLLPGRYRYKYVVNHDRWTDDPGNGMKEPDNFGGFNSILNLV